MKLSIFVICSLFCLSAFAQNPPQKVNQNYQFKSLGADSGGMRLPVYMLVPISPTPAYIAPGAIAYQSSDSTVRVWTGTEWLETIRVTGVWDTTVSLPLVQSPDSTVYEYFNIDGFMSIRLNLFYDAVLTTGRYTFQFGFNNVPTDCFGVSSISETEQVDDHDDTEPDSDPPGFAAYSSSLPVATSGNNYFCGSSPSWYVQKQISATMYFSFYNALTQITRQYCFTIQWYREGVAHFHIVRNQ